MFKRKKTVFTLIVAVIAILTIPVGLYLSLNPQTLRTKAAVANTTLSILPTNQTIQTGQKASVDVFLSPNGTPIHALELVINYDPVRIQIADISPGSFFTSHGTPVTLIKNLSVAGRIHYALGFPPGSKYASTTVAPVARIYFSGKAAGTTRIDLITTGHPYTIAASTLAENMLLSVGGATINIFQPVPSATPTPPAGIITCQPSGIYLSSATLGQSKITATYNNFIPGMPSADICVTVDGGTLLFAAGAGPSGTVSQLATWIQANKLYKFSLMKLPSNTSQRCTGAEVASCYVTAKYLIAPTPTGKILPTPTITPIIINK